MFGLLVELKWNATSYSTAAAIFHCERYCKMIFKVTRLTASINVPHFWNVVYTSSSITLHACSGQSAAAYAVCREQNNSLFCSVSYMCGTLFSACVVSNNVWDGIKRRSRKTGGIHLFFWSLRQLYARVREPFHSKSSQYHIKRCFPLLGHDLTRSRVGKQEKCVSWMFVSLSRFVLHLN